MTYLVERGIEIPEVIRGRRSRYPFATMAVGDAVVIARQDVVGARTSASTLAKRTGKRFTSRSLDDGSIRIWRVA